MKNVSRLTDFQPARPTSAREAEVLNHLLRRNLFSQVDTIMTENASFQVTDLLSQLQSQSKDNFKQTLLEQMAEKENRQRAEQQRLLEQLKCEEAQLQKSALKRNNEVTAKAKRDGSLIINANKVLNDGKHLNELLNEMKAAQKVPTIDLTLAEKTIQKSQQNKREINHNHVISKPTEKPIFHNDSKGFERSLFTERNHPPYRFGFEHQVPNIESKVVDCSDVYALIDAQVKRNRIFR